MAVLNRGRCYWARRTDPAHHAHRDSTKARRQLVDWKEKVSDEQYKGMTLLPFCDAEAFTSARKDRIWANVILPLCHIYR